MARGTSVLICAGVMMLTACGGSTATDSGANAGSGGLSNTGGSPSGGGGSGAAGAGGGIAGIGGFSTGGVGTGGGVSAKFSGVWSGYIENYAFDDGSDAMVMTLDITTAGVSGHVQFGNSPLLAPPTDPNVGYPPGVSGPAGGGCFGPLPNNDPMAGFSYSILDGSFDGQRLKFQIAPAELYKAWCEMQTPYVDDINAGLYQCEPNWGGGCNPSGCFLTDPKTGQNVSVDCGKLQLCQSVCQCNSQSCSVNLPGGVSFDMQLNPPSADGSVADLAGGIHNVHLKHQ